jgi:hypothetical protein
MRNMSFSMTTDQVRAGTKDVTRRLGWSFLKPGDRLMAVEKCQGLKKGECIKRIREIEIVSNEPEPLENIIYNPFRNQHHMEVDREGFPGVSPIEFIKMFCAEMGTTRTSIVNRIEFKYVG